MSMPIKAIAHQGITHPFGDHRAVKQAFPSAIPSEHSDPFLMCDYFDLVETTGKARHDDDFPIDWHPHRGMDIATYLRSGVGRHADSLGNRETFDSPGMQWMSVGSGVEHAEGGATDAGIYTQGFQIWINVPADRKMDDPRYGTVPSKDLPMVTLKDGGGTALVLAGDALGVHGPFETVQDVQMIDFRVERGASLKFSIAEGLDTAILYVYEGCLKSANGENDIQAGSVILLDAGFDSLRGLKLQTKDEDDAGVMLFAGKKLKEPIAWHGPIVMNTQEQIRTTLSELRSGTFPPKRVGWDYKRMDAFPKK
jgi:redox-sensitive bicupin YhaK (pirin superfamily)